MRSLGGVEKRAALLCIGGADDLIVHDDSPRLTVGSDSAGRRFNSENARARGPSGTGENRSGCFRPGTGYAPAGRHGREPANTVRRAEEHTSELQSKQRSMK